MPPLPLTSTEVEQLTHNVLTLVQRDRIRVLAAAGFPPVRVVGAAGFVGVLVEF